MGRCVPILMLIFATSASTFIRPINGRAVNISNTWMLPEEGFPVFYRYFRDRISWYEADAVCQFHHANLVTADTTKQYDAIRAYLKELDITDNVWIGLSRTSERPNFSWTDFRQLSGDGHWQEAIPLLGTDPQCVVMDPAADFLWKAQSCGGPDVAAFICELPIPTWAMGARGCLLTELPSLTVLYIPEHSALELTSDCGLDGTKRIACKGNADREEILKQLTCSISHDDFEEKSNHSSISSNNNTVPELSTASATTSDDNSLNSKTTKPWIWTSNTIDTDYGMPTRHRRETEDTLSPVATKTTTDLSRSTKEIKRFGGGSTPPSIVTYLPTNYDTEAGITTTIESGDVTLDASVTTNDKLITDGSSTMGTIQEIGIVGGVASDVSQTEEQAETFVSETVATTDARVVATSVDNVEDSGVQGEFPSAISQGQLFSIIENGTMFDIIELNETVTDDTKPKDIASIHHIKEAQHKSSTSHVTTKPSETIYTTVAFHKETPNDDKSFVTNKSIKNAEKLPKKDIYKNADPKKANYLPKSLRKGGQSIIKGGDKTVNALTTESMNNEGAQNLTKEMELFPIISDTSIILNRTNRKELPFIESTNELENNVQTKVDNTVTNDLNNYQHQHIEIKLSEIGKNHTFVVTTKRYDSKMNQTKNENSPSSTLTTPLAEIISTTLKPIDPKIDLLNIKAKEVNNDSEIIPSAAENSKIADESMLMKEQFLPKSLLGETKSITKFTPTMESSSETLEPEPEAQPRPNRQRQLTRPQRRSFYPYFFSRVLG